MMCVMHNDVLDAVMNFMFLIIQSTLSMEKSLLVRPCQPVTATLWPVFRVWFPIYILHLWWTSEEK